VTNWRRPQRGSAELVERAAALLSDQAAALGPTGMLLVARPDGDGAARYESLAGRLGFVGRLEPGALDGTWTEVALGPGYRACFVARPDGDGWRFATSFDADLVVECALLLMARLPQAPR
jgi:hypothetical protein